MELNRNAKLSDFFVYLDTLEAHKVLIKKSQASAKGNRTRLMTAHRSKGLEFEYVYIIKAFEGHWGNKRRPNLLPILPQALNISSEVKGEWDKNDDERRVAQAHYQHRMRQHNTLSRKIVLWQRCLQGHCRRRLHPESGFILTRKYGVPVRYRSWIH